MSTTLRFGTAWLGCMLFLLSSPRLLLQISRLILRTTLRSRRLDFLEFLPFPCRLPVWSVPNREPPLMHLMSRRLDFLGFLPLPCRLPVWSAPNREPPQTRIMSISRFCLPLPGALARRRRPCLCLPMPVSLKVCLSHLRSWSILTTTLRALHLMMPRMFVPCRSSRCLCQCSRVLMVLTG